VREGLRGGGHVGVGGDGQEPLGAVEEVQPRPPQRLPVPHRLHTQHHLPQYTSYSESL
jgi:hypothetical protein